MKQVLALLKKDLRNVQRSFAPALLLGLPVFLLIGFANEIEDSDGLSWQSGFWISFFIASTGLFYRSFSLDHQHQSFLLYRGLRVSRLLLFGSQVIVQAAFCILIGMAYLFLAFIFWSPANFELSQALSAIVMVSLSLSPMGCLLALLLSSNREFLFSVFYFSLSTPVILAGRHLTEGLTAGWTEILVIFLLVGSFVSALLFEFFFDEFTQSH